MGRSKSARLRPYEQRKNHVKAVALAFLVQILLSGASDQARAQSQGVPYSAMAPLTEYLMPDNESEIALARSAAPKSISGKPKLILGKLHQRA